MPDTETRTLRRRLKLAQQELLFALKERDHYRSRATKAEQAVSEWQARFDALLSKVQRAEVKP